MPGSIFVVTETHLAVVLHIVADRGALRQGPGVLHSDDRAEVSDLIRYRQVSNVEYSTWYFK